MLTLRDEICTLFFSLLRVASFVQQGACLTHSRELNVSSWIIQHSVYDHSLCKREEETIVFSLVRKMKNGADAHVSFITEMCLCM